MPRDTLHYLVRLYPLVSALVGMLVAQVLKSVFIYIKEAQVNLNSLFSSGGMPSSHATMVSSLTTAIGLQVGWTSSLFCICVVFSLVVIYDAAGVRRAAGKQAAILNQILDDLKIGKYSEGKLTELLGHTPLEVIAGILLGIGIAFSLYY